MSRRLITSSRFRRDAKRIRKQGLPASELLYVVDLLIEGKPIPEEMDDHPLKGSLDGFRDLHIRPDWVLLYRITDDSLLLQRTGSHSEIFGK
ncbi:MAG: type II toxin-antitoxin system YafQ family toxin [Synergistaceae bacterium]|nr:type II toxin-antitoxin system YafQ family toxin [Synergistaceae bacterium]